MIPFHAHALAAAFLALGAVSAAAQATGPVQYALDPASDFTQGCYPPCLCPIFLQDAFEGTFVLQYTMSDPQGFDHYAVTSVDWRVGTLNPDLVTGTGQYKRGGQVALFEQLVLDLSVNGQPAEHYDSGLVQPVAPFPALDISISLNGMVCFDKVFHVVAVPGTSGSPFCAGDGTGTACPCGNSGSLGNGCASSVDPSGANLTANGVASLSGDSVVLHSTGTPNAALLFFQGTQQAAGGAGIVFGDGLRCAVGTIRRLRTVTASGGSAHIPGPGDPTVSSMGGITSPGVRDYQVWYRNAAAFCTGATFNLSNGFEITWNP
jgi:hypothetical protein